MDEKDLFEIGNKLWLGMNDKELEFTRGLSYRLGMRRLGLKIMLD